MPSLLSVETVPFSGQGVCVFGGNGEQRGCFYGRSYGRGPQI